MRLIVRVLICLGLFILFTGPSCSVAAQQRPVPISVKVEAEGSGKGRGMWVQGAKDLTARDTKTLETILLTEIKKQDGVEIVPLSYPDDFVGVAVVAAKLPNGNAGTWYIASSVMTIATKKGTDEFLTHDVFADADLTSLARAIAFQFASVRLQAAISLRK